jgi:peptidoglycan/LPS O-acetylase OafA/YrhL
MSALAPNVADGRNNPWLDLIRSIAILLVIARHGERALHAGSGTPQDVLQTIFMNGWVGVDLFFVLSGYLIARHLVRAGIGSRHFQVGRYLATRALRIIPAYYAVLFLVVAGAFPLFTVAPEALGYRVAYHLLFLQDYLPSNINVVFWSLGVEEKFYLLAPLLVFLLLRCRSAPQWLALLVLLLLLPFVLRGYAFLTAASGLDYAEFWRAFRSPFHMALEGLLVGVAIAIAQQAGIVRQSPRTGLVVLLAATALLAAWLGTHDLMSEIGASDYLIQPPLIALLAGAMTLGAVQLGGTAMPFAGPFRWLARLSYSLYLIHYPLIPMALALAAPDGAPAFWALYLFLSFTAALALYLVVERPFLQWKDRIGRKDQIPDSTVLALPKSAA